MRIMIKKVRFINNPDNKINNNSKDKNNTNNNKKENHNPKLMSPYNNQLNNKIKAEHKEEKNL